MLDKYLRGIQDGYLNAYFFAVQMVTISKMVHVGHVLTAVLMAKELVSAQVPPLHLLICCMALLVSCIPPC